jgi:Spy/CpxP family protein refolding chaperone
MSDAANVRPTRWLSGLAFAATLMLPSLAFAQAAATPAPTPAPAKGGFSLDAGMNALDKTLAKADATPEQKAKIKAVIFDAVMSLAAQGQALKTTGSQFGAALMAPHVDRSELETARVSAVAEFDAFSKVMVKAIGDAAEVLTPEQRAKLAASAKPKS